MLLTATRLLVARRQTREHFSRRFVVRYFSRMQFIQRYNAISGEVEWEKKETDYDYCREIARSSYADMLHDTERNKMYYEAIKLAVEEIHKRGKKAKVLDIGTGTGLLSMMAASAGAEQITAIEMFTPMSRVAKHITKKNGFGFIKIINKHSTEIQMGIDMKEKANILVTELFDTELIGEGALVAYHHAHKNLMEEGCLAVPHSATTYVQLVESKLMYSWHTLYPIKIMCDDGREKTIEPDPSMKECSGVPAVHDIQLSQIKRNQFKAITDAVEVFQFDWSSKQLSPSTTRKYVSTKATSAGKAQVILSWWALSMDRKGDIILSTAPYWFHPTPSKMQWRDHWIQSVYFMPQTLDVEKGDDLIISASHDAYSMWFDATLNNRQEMCIEDVKHPVCSYLPRMLWSRPRLAMLSDENRNNHIVQALKTVDFDRKNHTTVCISDVSLISLFAACFSSHQIYALETGRMAARGIENLVRHNGMSDQITVLDLNAHPDYELPLPEHSVDLLIGEPFFNNSLLPWFDLKFWYIRSILDKYLSPSARIMPLRARLCVVAVQFKDLWKIRAPVGHVEGFDVSFMDEMISDAMETEDYHEPEPHALWEYPNVVVSAPKHMLTFDFTKPIPPNEVCTSGHIELKDTAETCHGVALWMEYDLTENITLSTGLLNSNSTGTEWNMNYKQGVFFLRKPVSVSNDVQQLVRYEISFIPQTRGVKMKFKTNGTDCL